MKDSRFSRQMKFYKDRGAVSISSPSIINAKVAGRQKGEIAEAFAPALGVQAGTWQNMLWTVTYVERYRNLALS